MDSEFKTFIFDEESFRDSAGLFGFANICVFDRFSFVDEEGLHGYEVDVEINTKEGKVIKLEFNSLPTKHCAWNMVCFTLECSEYALIKEYINKLSEEFYKNYKKDS